MLDELDVKLQIALTLSTLLLRESVGSTALVFFFSLNGNWLQSVITCASVGFGVSVAFFAQVIIGASIAMVSGSGEDFTTT